MVREGTKPQSSYPLWLFCTTSAILDMGIYSFLAAYFSTYLEIPHNRWVSIYRDFNDAYITDYSKPQEKIVTYKLEWAVRVMITLCTAHLILNHILVFAVQVELKYWILPYIIWNVMMIWITAVMIISFFLVSSIDSFEDSATYMDFNRYWMWGLTIVLIYQVSAEILVWSHFNELHFRPIELPKNPDDREFALHLDELIERPSPEDKVIPK